LSVVCDRLVVGGLLVVFEGMSLMPGSHSRPWMANIVFFCRVKLFFWYLYFRAAIGTFGWNVPGRKDVLIIFGLRRLVPKQNVPEPSLCFSYGFRHP